MIERHGLKKSKTSALSSSPELEAARHRTEAAARAIRASFEQLYRLAFPAPLEKFN